jgi:hypothetical protein
LPDPTIAQRILELRRADLDLRDRLLRAGQLNDGYHEEMAALHDRNATVLEEIIDSVGYPSEDRIGEPASAAAWLVVQHAIGRPDFMRKCRDLLAQAVQQERADPVRLAYLDDRIAVLEGRRQRYGTQFDWDENGELSPQPMDDPEAVARRRKTLGLTTLEARTASLRQRAREENQRPPKDWNKQQRAYEAWRKEVGWVCD